MSRPLTISFLVSALLHVGLFATVAQRAPGPLTDSDAPRAVAFELMVYEPLTPPAPEGRSKLPMQPQPEVVETPPDLPDRRDPIEPAPAKELAVVPEPEPKAQQPKRPAVRSKPVHAIASRAQPAPRKASVDLQPDRPEPSPPSQSQLARPAGVVPSRPEQAVVAVADAEIRNDYLAALTSKIQHSKFYPRSARRRGEEGRVVISFVIRKDGGLENIAVSESSGYRRLDEAAMKTLQRVSPFKPIPETLGRDHWAISVPIAYSLRS